MWTSQYDIIVETLTGSEFEVSVTDEDTVGYIKSRIQKYEGIPINQQHLIYNQKELNDATEVKDIPLVKGSRLKLVLGLKGGPVSARRVVLLPDFDTTWFDLSDVLNTSRQDPLTISSPGVKLLVYKDCKKNIHRVMKFRTDRKSSNNANSESAADLSVDVDGQFLKDNLNTMEKMHQLRTQLELKKKEKHSKFNGNGSDDADIATSTSSFGEQCVNNLMKLTKNECDRRHSDNITGGSSKKDSGDHIDYWNVSSQIARRMYFAPLKTPTDNNNQMPFKKPVDGSAMLKKRIRNEFTSFTNEFSNHPIVGSMLNKHGTAKTCLRSSMLTQKQKMSSTVASTPSTPSTGEIVAAAALFDTEQSPTNADSSTFRKKHGREQDKRMESKAIGNHLIELIRTSKMSVSPSWQGKFETTVVPSTLAAGSAITSEKSNSSDAIATAGTSSTTSLNELHVMPLSQSMATMTTTAAAAAAAASTTSRNFISSEMHRSKMRDNIRRNRSFKALISKDYIIEENHHNRNQQHHHHHPHQQQYQQQQQQQHPHHQYQYASSTAAASVSAINSSRQYSSASKKSKMPFNSSVQDLLEKFNSSTKLKGNHGNAGNIGNADGNFNCFYHHNDVRSNESLTDFAKSSNSTTAPPFLSSLRSGKSSLLIDLKAQFDKCGSRRMHTPKFAYNGFENKLFVENPSTAATSGANQHLHAPSLIGSREKCTSFSGNEYKFDGVRTSNAASASNATTTSMGSSATATAIADSSSFRVFKMTSDAKNYELPKLLIREGSPIESFHSSHPQLETLALHCESPKNIIDTLATAQPNTDTLTISTANTSPSSSPSSPTTSQMNTLLTSSELPCDTSARLDHHNTQLNLNNHELDFVNDEDLPTNYATNYLKKNASVLKIASNLEINNWSNADTEYDCNKNQTTTSNATANFINGAMVLPPPNRTDPFAEACVNDGISNTNNRIYTINDHNSNNNSCERLHNATKAKSVELNEFSVIFGSSPTLLNYNQVGPPTSRLDAIPSQYRRGYTNLNDACMSNSSSDLSRLPCYSGGGGAGTKKTIKRTDEMASPPISSGTIGSSECADDGKGISHEISSLLRHRSDGPLDYVRSYENLDRAKIVRMKTDNRNSVGGSNYNCTHSQSNSSNGTIDTGSSVRDWKSNNHFDYFNEQQRIGQEEDTGDDYSYLNLGYDNAYGAVGYSIGDYQSNESLFNINFDAMDDEVFEIDAMGLFENDLATPNTELLLDEKCSIYDGPFSNGKNATAIHMDSGKSNRLLLPNIPQSCSQTDDMPTMYQLSSDHLTKSNIESNCPAKAHTITDTVDSVESSLAISLNAKAPDTPDMAATVQKPKKLRCAECNKKLGLIMIMKCHCERIFCAQHRYAEAHRCTYNFKLEGQKTIARENPLVVAQKLPKI